MSLSDVGALFIAAIVAFLLAGTLAPLEALGWWAGWFGPPRRSESDEASPSDPPPATDVDTWVVFLSGIHTVSGRTFSRREQNFLYKLKKRIPDVPIEEVFPYSVTDRPLTGDRVMGRFWRWALSMKLSRRTMAGLAGMVINLRNVWQVAVSADRRYGPIYNQGSADIIAAALRRRGFPTADTRPAQDGSSAHGARPRLVLIGYSGGGQVALGAAGPLQRMLDAPVTVVSLGGVMSADPSLRDIDALYHLVGSRDKIHRIGDIFSPGRWPLFPYSAWQQARQRGAIHFVDMGPPDHTGRGGYLDATATLPDGRSFVEQTVDVVAAIVEDRDPREQVGAPAATAP